MIKGYTFVGSLYLAFCVFYTRMIFPKARLIRFPFRLRVMGSIDGCEDFTSGVSCRIDVFNGAILKIGKNVQINDFCHIACAKDIEIGEDVLIASRVFITDHDHLISDVPAPPSSTGLSVSAVRIGNRSWLGEGVCILKGVALGEDCVVAANAVVTKSFPKGSIIGGVPAKMIKSRDL